jgi:hypothetical protein
MSTTLKRIGAYGVAALVVGTVSFVGGKQYEAKIHPSAVPPALEELVREYNKGNVRGYSYEIGKPRKFQPTEPLPQELAPARTIRI